MGERWIDEKKLRFFPKHVNLYMSYVEFFLLAKKTAIKLPSISTKEQNQFTLSNNLAWTPTVANPVHTRDCALVHLGPVVFIPKNPKKVSCSW
jgi:branched-subunit amino acid transport protein